MHHTIPAPSFTRISNPRLFDRKVAESVTQLGEVNVGDTIAITNGNCIHVVENLTDFTACLPEHGCRDILGIDWGLRITPIKAHHSINALTPTKTAYSFRVAVDKTGHVVHQALVKAFDEPVWVNLGDNERITSIED